MDSHKKQQTLEEFLQDQCDATKEKYAKALASLGDDFGKASDFDYAESLVYFGLAERRVFLIKSGEHIRGSKTWFRKTPKTTTTLCIQAKVQTEYAL